MVDNRTDNKNYPLPNPQNIASQDVERIATAISMIDVDIQDSDEKIADINEIAENLKKTALQIPEEFIGKINPEIQGVGAKKYIIVNSERVSRQLKEEAVQAERRAKFLSKKAMKILIQLGLIPDQF